MSDNTIESKINKQTIVGYSVHAFTAIGAIFAFLSLRALFEGRPRETMLWLFVTLVVDGLDGPIARKLSVKKSKTKLNGDMLDLVVDYLTYVLIPALFMWKFELFPQKVSVLIVSLVLTVGALYFARTDMKTDDNWFRGFPASWNILALSLWILNTSAWLNAVVFIISIILCFTDIKFVHVVRSKQLISISLPFTLVFLVVSFSMIAIDGQLNNIIGKTVIVLWLCYYFGLAVWRTWVIGD